MIVDDEKRASELGSSDVLRRLNEANWDQIYPELVYMLSSGWELYPGLVGTPLEAHKQKILFKKH